MTPRLKEPDFNEADVILVNDSGGKDSNKMLNVVVNKAIEHDVLDKVVIAHAEMEEEWQGTVELVKSHADQFGLRFEKEKRPQGSLLDHVKERGKWPSPQQRFCTSDHKRGQIHKIYTRLVKEFRAKGRKTPVIIINCLGMRAEESPGRKKLPVFAFDKRASNGRREVYNWLPIHKVTDKEAFDSIGTLPTADHKCYSCGIKRASCVFCIYAPDHQIQRAAMLPENQELWKKYLDLEKEIDHTFKNGSSLREVEDRIQAGEEVTVEDDGKWNM